MVGSSTTQSSRTSPGSFGTNHPATSVSSSASSPQSLSKGPSGLHNAMSADVYSNSVSQPPPTLTSSFSYPFSPIGTSASFDGLGANGMRLGETDLSPPMNGFHRMGSGAAILMRRLPQNTSREALRSMFLFAKDFVDADFIPSELPEDGKFLCAIARFNTVIAAEEARAMLDGKPNSSNEANMIVEMFPGPLPNRRNTIDHTASRGLGGPTPRHSSRFNGTFQTMTNGSSHHASANDALPAPDTNSRLHSIFSPRSPIGSGLGELPRVSGKSVIDQDLDEETGELLKDPVGYAQNGHGNMPLARRSTNPSLPTGRFASLSLSTNVTSPSVQGFTNGTNGRMGMATPASAMPPNLNGNAPFLYSNQHNPRHSLPAANPNDLNPPCNTLYVGNLPADTQEEELKALFSKQRGYKRLCFRNKQNGPMCFVEFDEVAMASKALNELYGYKLSNSVKTGIRLSFSKNPLGVRSGQPGSSVNPPTPLSPQTPIHGGAGIGSLPNAMFSTASGPPPGLSAPPGLALPMGARNGPMPPPNSHASMANGNSFSPTNTGLGIRANGMNGLNSIPFANAIPGNSQGHTINGFSNVFPDYMMGR
jgi:hypothetical protein